MSFELDLRPSKWTRIIALLCIVALVLAMALAATWIDWTWKRKLPVRGGMYFFRRVELAVPQFRQGDPQWRDDPLGSTPGTLAAEGCAVASAAMVLKFYGIDTDPQKLNWFLTAHDGYVGNGWLVWEKAADFTPGLVEKAYEDLPSFWLIDSNLLRGNPCIIRIRFPSGITHFVVIVGKQGSDYLIRDPGAGAAKGVYPLRELAHQIEALRFYRRLRPAL